MNLMSKLIMNLRATLYVNPTKRRAFRKEFWTNYMENEKKVAVWGVSYSVFDGEELLEGSIKCLRPVTNYINVVYSPISWYGEEANPTLLGHLIELRDKGLIDELIEFVPDIKKVAAINETNKRNVGLEAARKFGCTYFMPIDTDEFYRTDEVIKMQNNIIEQQITHSYCVYVDYGYTPSERRLGNDVWGTTFFSKLVKSSKLGASSVLLCDATKTLSHYKGAKYYVLHGGAVHHMPLVRRDLSKKMRNSGSPGAVACEKSILGDKERRKLEREKEMNSYPSKNIQVAPTFIRVPDEFNIGNIGEY